MRIPSNPLLLLPALLPTVVSATGFDCKHITADGYKYDLSPLGGVHTLYQVDETEDYAANTTYVLNICNILKGASMRDDMKCGTSKNICGFQTTRWTDADYKINYAFPIAGLDHVGSGTKDPEITRLKKLDSSAEGLLVKLAGGEYKASEKAKAKPARAALEFQCDLDRTGLEGLETREDDDGKQRRAFTQVTRKREDGTDQEGDSANSLQFVSFESGEDEESYVLKLDWKTRYACDTYLRDHEVEKAGGHWGFFTWLIIIVFLCTAAYLIFGSWLNYNRYGARGWDLLPHADTIRDIPYILQDWVKRVINTLQGTGSRGGYSAV